MIRKNTNFILKLIFFIPLILLLAFTACSRTKSVEEYHHSIEISWVKQDMDTCINIVTEYAKEYKQEMDTKAFCEEFFENYDREFKLRPYR